MAKADEVYGRVVEEATAGLNTGLATRGGAPAFLVRAFSLAEQEDLLMDFDQLTTMEKVHARLRGGGEKGEGGEGRGNPPLLLWG